MNLEHSAGGLVYRQHGREVDICMIKDSYGRWTFPKGHLEVHESLEEAARREIGEETGIDETLLRLRRELGEINYRYVAAFGGGHPKNINKFVTYYLFEVPQTVELTAQVGEVQNAEWVPISEIGHFNDYEDNVAIINRAKAVLSP